MQATGTGFLLLILRNFNTTSFAEHLQTTPGKSSKRYVTPLVYVYTFYCLGNMLSLYAENFLSFLCFTQRTSWIALPSNPSSPKHHMMFFREQIELQVAPAQLTPGISTCSFFQFSIRGKSMSSTLCHLFRYFLE